MQERIYPQHRGSPQVDQLGGACDLSGGGGGDYLAVYERQAQSRPLCDGGCASVHWRQCVCHIADDHVSVEVYDLRIFTVLYGILPGGSGVVAQAEIKILWHRCLKTCYFNEFLSYFMERIL